MHVRCVETCRIFVSDWVAWYRQVVCVSVCVCVCVRLFIAQLAYADSSFDLVIDKGTIDAMLCSSTGAANAASICAEAARVLCPEGVFVLVSHMSPESDEGASFLSESLLPALHTQSASAAWAVEVHHKVLCSVLDCVWGKLFSGCIRVLVWSGIGGT